MLVYKHGQAAINHQKGVTACANELIKISWQSSYQRDNDDNNGGSGARRRRLHRLAKRLRHSLLECATRTYGRQIYTSYIRLTFWQRKKEKLKIVSIYVPLSCDEGWRHWSNRRWAWTRDSKVGLLLWLSLDSLLLAACRDGGRKNNRGSTVVEAFVAANTMKMGCWDFLARAPTTTTRVRWRADSNGSPDNRWATLQEQTVVVSWLPSAAAPSRLPTWVLLAAGHQDTKQYYPGP